MRKACCVIWLSSPDVTTSARTSVYVGCSVVCLTVTGAQPITVVLTRNAARARIYNNLRSILGFPSSHRFANSCTPVRVNHQCWRRVDRVVPTPLPFSGLAQAYHCGARTTIVPWTYTAWLLAHINSGHDHQRPLTDWGLHQIL